MWSWEERYMHHPSTLPCWTKSGKLFNTWNKEESFICFTKNIALGTVLDEFKDALNTEHYNVLVWLRYSHNRLKSSFVNGMLYNRAQKKML